MSAETLSRHGVTALNHLAIEPANHLGSARCPDESLPHLTDAGGFDKKAFHGGSRSLRSRRMGLPRGMLGESTLLNLTADL